MDGGSAVTLRRATLADVDALHALIQISARGLSRADYTMAQIEAALRGAFGVDTQLIHDGSYFLIEIGGRLAGCGGWSRRRTLFGSDARLDRDPGELDPAVDAAKIRAFFVHPDFSRRGLGTMLLERCEREAVSHGFRRLEMMATLPGVRLYAARGYLAQERVDWPLGPDLTIQFVRMSKVAPPPDVEIMPACMADAGEILALQKLSYESEALLYEDWSLPPLTQTIDSLRSEITNSVVYVARTAVRLDGSVRARLEGGICRVGRLIVRPELQGRGIGTLLLRTIEGAFPHAGTFELFTGSRSASNLRLCERLGYRRCREQVMSPALTLVYLRKDR